MAPFIAAAQSLGVPFCASLNDPEVSASAVALHELTGEQGRRASAGEFLWGEKGGFGEGLKVGTGAVVRRLEVDGEGQVKGVWFGEDDGKGESGLLCWPIRQNLR